MTKNDYVALKELAIKMKTAGDLFEGALRNAALLKASCQNGDLPLEQLTAFKPVNVLPAYNFPIVVYVKMSEELAINNNRIGSDVLVVVLEEDDVIDADLEEKVKGWRNNV